MHSRILCLWGVAVFLVFALFLSCAAHAKRPPVAIDLSKNHVDITSAFSGEYLVLFGVQNEDGDLVITITGPPKSMVVRRKDRYLGMWINRAEQKFDNVPSYYNIALSRPDIDAAALGLDAGADVTAHGKKEGGVFKQALIRNKITQHLFTDAAEPIIYIDEGFFRTKFYIPANVSTGDFVITTHLIKGKKSREIGQTRVSVKQIGTADAVLRFSREHTALYGLLSVLLAVSVGWLSNYIRGRLR